LKAIITGGRTFWDSDAVHEVPVGFRCGELGRFG